MRIAIVMVGALLMAACRATSGPAEALPAPLPEPRSAAAPSVSDPAYLEHWPGLFAREGDRIVDAPAADIAVARSYPRYGNKGPLTATGERLTIMTAKRRYAAGEPIRVIHVYEASLPGVEVYVMGPKAIYGETIDGEAVTPPEFVFRGYDGAVLPAPALDYNYEVTEYRLPRGIHVIRWSQRTHAEGSPRLTSNALTVRVE